VELYPVVLTKGDDVYIGIIATDLSPPSADLLAMISAMDELTAFFFERWPVEIIQRGKYRFVRKVPVICRDCSHIGRDDPIVQPDEPIADAVYPLLPRCPTHGIQRLYDPEELQLLQFPVA